MCRRVPFAQNGGSSQSTKSGAGNHQLLCRQAGEGQPRALPHQPRRRGGRASSTDGRGRASSRQERRLSLFRLCVRWIRGSGILASHAKKRSVRPSPRVSDRPNFFKTKWHAHDTRRATLTHCIGVQASRRAREPLARRLPPEHPGLRESGDGTRTGAGASLGAQLAIIGLTSFQSSLRMSNLSR